MCAQNKSPIFSRGEWLRWDFSVEVSRMMQPLSPTSIAYFTIAFRRRNAPNTPVGIRANKGSISGPVAGVVNVF